MDFINYIIIFNLIVIILALIFRYLRIKKIRDKIDLLSKSALEVTPNEFFRLRNTSNGGRGREHISKKYDFSGVYILFNKTKNMVYVGQGVSVFKRVNSHFTGKGNGDVYADYKYGDEFTIKMISLENSGFSTLNELERHTIARYNSYYKGYNKTRGNHG